ncbi:MAG TPA: hypothetical protein VFN56_03255 [Candidatus Saccharimonadales bacterium]|nr:hypothetical protein [Candidatus Saccharimonadales bacterium]
MAKTKTTIEINGKRYDAVRGTVLNHSRLSGSIDGVVKGKQPVVVTPTVQTKPSLPLTPVSSTPVMDVQRTRTRTSSPALGPKKHVPQSSQTLMRQGVQKPTSSFKKAHKSQTRTDVLAKQPKNVVLPKLSFHTVDATREARATQVSQSKFVSRFATMTVPRKAHASPTPIATVAKSSPQVRAVTTPAVIPQPLPSISGHSSSNDLFERALRKATSHEQPAHPTTRRAKKSSHRLLNAGALSLAVLLLGGFFVYQNLANITIHMAARKAGFAAALPGYRPSGFSIGNLAYSTGNVTIRFHSNSDTNRSFALVEQPSSWDSSTLLSDYVATTAGNSYQTATAAGRTVYLYGSNNATWVSGGIWYRVTNQNGLSTTQLIDLATSM